MRLLFSSLALLNTSTASLYSAIYQYILSKPEIAELTVEDPAEAFEDLRDKNDLIMLFNHEKFLSEGFGAGGSDGGRVGGIGKAGRSGRGGSTNTSGKLGPPVDKHWAERMRLELKIASVSTTLDLETNCLIIFPASIPTTHRDGRALKIRTRDQGAESI